MGSKKVICSFMMRFFEKNDALRSKDTILRTRNLNGTTFFPFFT